MMNTSVQFYLHPGKASPGKLSQLWLRINRNGLIRNSYTGLDVDPRYWDEESRNVTPEHPRSIAIGMKLALLKLRVSRFRRLVNAGTGLAFELGMGTLLRENGIAETQAFIRHYKEQTDPFGLERLKNPNWSPIPQLEKVIPAFASLIAPVKLPEVVHLPPAVPAPVQPAPEPEPAPATPPQAEEEPDEIEQERALIEEDGSELEVNEAAEGKMQSNPASRKRLRGMPNVTWNSPCPGHVRHWHPEGEDDPNETIARSGKTTLKPGRGPPPIPRS
jgi:hypothetical protein